MKYNKLIRDKIPLIIKDSGNQCVIRVLSDDEYYDALNKKLRGELKEYESSHEIEELADMLEVIYAIAESRGIPETELDSIRVHKAYRNGQFNEKFMLISTTKHKNEGGSITLVSGNEPQ